MKIGIVGAGPAGMSTALFLAKKGISCTIFEKSQFPKDKFCGECYDGRAWKVLNELEIPEIKDFVENEMLHIREYEINMNGKELLKQKFEVSKSPRIIARRKEFDNQLWKVIENESLISKCIKQIVKEIFIQNDKFLLKTQNNTYEFDLVIWASGNQEFQIGEKYFLKIPQANYFFYRRYFKPKIRLEKVKINFISQPYPLSLVLSPMKDGQINVELGIPKNKLDSLQNNLDVEIRKQLNYYYPDLFDDQTYFEESTLGVHYYVGQKTHQFKLPEKFFLIGDSFSKVNPISGYGVGHSLEHGKLMAELIAIDSNPTMKKFSNKINKKLHKELKINKLMNFFIRYPSILKVIFKWKWFSKNIINFLS